MVAQLLRLRSRAGAERCGGRRRRGTHAPAHGLRRADRILPPGRLARDDRARQRSAGRARGRHDRRADRRRRRLRSHRARRASPSGCRRPAAGSAFTPSWSSRKTAGRSSASTDRASGWSSSGCSARAGSVPSSRWPCSRRLGPERTVRSILARDLAALSSVGGIGRKKAERLVLELQDQFGDV